MTLKSSFRVVFFVLLALIIFLGFEFFYTSRMTLNVAVQFPEEMDPDVAFKLKLYSDDYTEERTIGPKHMGIKYENLPFGDYFFEIVLDERTVMKEFKSFESEFTLMRKNETANLNLAEFASITSMTYKLEDPYLSLKWNGKYLGAFKPAQYLFSLNGMEEKINVNYIQIDLLKEILSGNNCVCVDISPLTRDGKKILSYHYELPVSLSKAEIVIPENKTENRQYFNVYDMSINIQGKNIPVDPYDPIIEFPVIEEGEAIPYNLQYYGSPIFVSKLIPSEDSKIIIPELPGATITSVKLNGATTTLTLGIESESDFLMDRFTYFRINNGTLTTTTEDKYTYLNEDQAIEITPFFMPDIYGDKLNFKVPLVPSLHVHTVMRDSEGNYSPEIKLYSDSSLSVKGVYSYDNGSKIQINAFKENTALEYGFSKDEVHNLNVEVEDSYGQKGIFSKWISSAMPETTFFKHCYIDKDRILRAEWDSLEVYDRIEVIVTDTYSIKRMNPTDSKIVYDLGGTAFQEPLKVIIRGFIDEEQYTAAVFEGLLSVLKEE